MKKNIAFFILFLSTPLFASSKLNFQTKTISESSTAPKYSIKVSYPQIASPATLSEKNFNSLAKSLAVKKITEFKQSQKSIDTSTLPNDIKANGSSLNVKYDLFVIDKNKAISLRYSKDSYIAGAAHGSMIYNSLNYDLMNNHELALSDLFKANTPYLKNIATYSQNKVKEKLTREANGKADIFKEGFAPNNKNYAVWNLTPKGLRFTFNEYQVAAYVFGPQEVFIPYKHLAQNFKSTSLTHCLANECSILQIK